MKTLVLAPSFAPIEEIPVERAVVLVLQGRAQSLKDHPTRVFRNATGRVRIPAPLVIVLDALADFAGVVFGRASWTRAGVYLRDGYTCQYCGRHDRDLVHGAGRRDVTLRYGSQTVGLVVSGEFLTIDHVTPQSAGGRNEYENTVTACSTCNGRKDNRTPAQAQMYLRRKPRALTRAELFVARLSDEARDVVDAIFMRPS
ncbi:MAG TPA: HNH endonuclease [Phycisphaerae bacterium]|nr:HNH endonuclease [Phycisphaerae bacterium]